MKHLLRIGRWAWRELWQHKLFSFLFLLNLCFGLVGITALDLVQNSVQQALRINQKNLLAADLGISARRTLTDAEKSAALNHIPHRASSDVLDMVTMIRAKGLPRLIQLRGIDAQYPFYGILKLQNQGEVHAGTPKTLERQDRIWLSKELAEQMHVQIGDSVQVGQKTLTIEDLVVHDNAQGFRLGSMGLRAWIDRQKLKETGLIQFGSTLTETLLFQLNENPDPGLARENEKVMVQILNLAVPDPAIQIMTPKLAGEDAGRFLGWVGDYLGLVSLVALALGLVGMGYLLRSYLQSREQDLLIYQILGLSGLRAKSIYAVQVLFLVLFASFLSLLVAWALAPMVLAWIRRFSPLIENVYFGSSVILGNVSAAGLASLGLLIPLFWVQRGQKLFVQFLAWCPLLFGFWALSVWRSHSWKVGSYFSAGLILSALALVGLSWVFLWLLSKQKLSQKLGWQVRQSILSLSRRPKMAIPGIAVLGLAALLMNLIPQIRYGLDSDLSSPDGLTLPSLFLLDLQDDQVGSFQAWLQDQKVEGAVLSPMIRARLLQVNGQAFERQASTDQVLKTREEENESRFRNRGFNLSIRDQLSKSETLVKGLAMTRDHADAAQVSLEEGFADRMHLHLGDELIFDVQGAEIKARVKNLRSVQWNSFQPNFFIVFQSGYLEEAPKTWIGSLPKMPEEISRQLQTQLLEKFPNVSIIDVKATIASVLELTSQVAVALMGMSVATLLVGAIVVLSILQHQITQRRWDLNLMQVLGGSSKQIRRLLLLEFGTIGVVAAALGLVLSLGLSWALSYFLLDRFISWDWRPILAAALTVGVGTFLLTLVMVGRLVQVRPQQLLQESSGASLSGLNPL